MGFFSGPGGLGGSPSFASDEAGVELWQEVGTAHLVDLEPGKMVVVATGVACRISSTKPSLDGQFFSILPEAIGRNEQGYEYAFRLIKSRRPAFTPPRLTDQVPVLESAGVFRRVNYIFVQEA